MKKRFVLAVVGFMLPLFAFAQVPANQGGGDISQAKQKIHQHIQERVHTLENTDACVAAAETRDAMRACREAQRASMQQAKAEHQADGQRSVRDERRRRGARGQDQ
jgi:hypothetical protein